jgi:hypothetical protein
MEPGGGNVHYFLEDGEDFDEEDKRFFGDDDDVIDGEIWLFWYLVLGFVCSSSHGADAETM